MHETQFRRGLMGAAAADPIGILTQWSSSLLLLLFFYRLNRSRARGPLLRTWIAAWAVLALSLAGSSVAAMMAMMDVTGHPSSWLDALYLPGRLLFIGLVGIGAFEAVGRGASRAARGIIALGLAGLGTLGAIANHPVLSGTLLVAATVAVFFGAPIAITSIDRRSDGTRVPLLGAMLLFGAATTTCLVAVYFADSMGLRGDPVTAVADSADYVTTVVLLILGAAVAMAVLEDTARGTRHLEGTRTRDRAESEARLAAIMASADAAIAKARAAADAERGALERQMAELVVVSGRDRAAPVVNERPGPLRAPPLQSRTVTLPPPPRRADGTTAEALLIDDKAEDRSTLARIFQRGGWAVRETSTAEEAVSWLLRVGAHTAPAVVLCEFHARGMGGRGVYEHLQRERPEFLDRLIFTIDNAAGMADAEFVQASGCATVIKPYSVGDVGRAVEAVLGPKGG